MDWVKVVIFGVGVGAALIYSIHEFLQFREQNQYDSERERNNARSNPERNVSENQSQERNQQNEDMDVCSVCLNNKLKIVFCPCGHRSCERCSRKLTSCHICRRHITQKQLYY